LEQRDNFEANLAGLTSSHLDFAKNGNRTAGSMAACRELDRAPHV